MSVRDDTACAIRAALLNDAQSCNSSGGASVYLGKLYQGNAVIEPTLGVRELLTEIRNELRGIREHLETVERNRIFAEFERMTGEKWKG